MTIITDNNALKTTCKTLEKQPFITIDTEFIRDKYYYPKLCLIQISDPKGNAFAIDPLEKDIDLSPLFQILQNENIVKVFHAARQDIEIFYQLTGQIPHPVFDTQVAAMVCGYGNSVSYSKLSYELANTEINKKHRFTDWSIRPLSEEQIQYALSDVIPLIKIYKEISNDLKKRGRTEWIQEEMETLTSEETYFVDPENYWKKLKINPSISAKEFTLIKELAKWREDLAQEKNLPRNHILKDGSLLDIASHAPTDRKQLHYIRGISRIFNNKKLERSLLEKLNEVLAKKNFSKDGIQKPKERYEDNALTDLLKVLLKAKAGEYEVADKLIGTAHEMEILANEDNPNLPCIRGWRYKIFGKLALDLKSGNVAINVKDKKINCFELTN